jgi:ATP-dependent helicase/nuclease subunit A
MTRPEDAAARQRIETSLGESLWVEAAAGTGKTTVLIARLVEVLATGLTTVDRIVALTFTRKAAGELELRLRLQLDRARQASTSPERRAHLDAAVARLEEASIGTIHSFCAEILRRRPVEARVDPNFVELDEDQAQALFTEVFKAWAPARLDQPSPAMRRALRRLAESDGLDDPPLDRLRDAAWSLVEWRDFPATWSRPSFDRQETIQDLLDRLAELSEMALQGGANDPLRRALLPIAAFLEASAADEQVAGVRDLDALEARLTRLLRELKRGRSAKGKGESFGNGLLRTAVESHRDDLIASLENFVRSAEADLAAILRDELWQVALAYEESKSASGRLDYLDLLLRCRDLVRDVPEVRIELAERFSHFFIDEMQDTDPLQAEILLLLAADDPEQRNFLAARPVPGKLFLVGDPKQSIYRFRRADLLLYRQLKENLATVGVGQVVLAHSFRARRSLQVALNAAFEPALDNDPSSGQADWVALVGGREDRPEEPSLIALPVPEPFGAYRISRAAIETSFPQAVAGFIETLLASPFEVDDPNTPTGRRRLQARDIALLFRRFVKFGREDVTADYARALKERRIPHVIDGARSIFASEELSTLGSALRAIEWPDDTLAVYATLRGDLFGLTDAQLLRFKNEVGPLSARQSQATARDPALVEVQQALDCLAGLHRERNERPLAETIHRLLVLTRAHAGLALRPAGDQVLANVQHLIDLARRFERRSGLSFRGFVEALAELAERPRERSAPFLGDDAEGVRLMTVFAAKGLEFPVVILADPTCRPSAAEPFRYHDSSQGRAAQRLLGCAPQDLLDHGDAEHRRDLAESVRLAYVAATRARDLLVVPVLGVGPLEDSWLGSLEPAIYPVAASKFAGSKVAGSKIADSKVAGSKVANGAFGSGFGDLSVLRGPSAGPARPPEQISPGWQQPRRGAHRILWWDPATLPKNRFETVAVRDADLLAPSEDKIGAGSSLTRYLDWQSSRADGRARGREPTIDVMIATEAVSDPPIHREIEVSLRRPDPSRPSGKRFGALVHAIFRAAGLAAQRPEIERLGRSYGRLLGADPREVLAASQAVEEALEHPLLRRAAQAQRRFNEQSFVLRLDSGLLVEGIIDLAFEEEDGWVVVELKTDLDEVSSFRYLRQIRWYVEATHRLSGKEAKGVLLGV